MSRVIAKYFQRKIEKKQNRKNIAAVLRFTVLQFLHCMLHYSYTKYKEIFHRF